MNSNSIHLTVKQFKNENIIIAMVMIAVSVTACVIQEVLILHKETIVRKLIQDRSKIPGLMKKSNTDC